MKTADGGSSWVPHPVALDVDKVPEVIGMTRKFIYVSSSENRDFSRSFDSDAELAAYDMSLRRISRISSADGRSEVLELPRGAEQFRAELDETGRLDISLFDPEVPQYEDVEDKRSGVSITENDRALLGVLRIGDTGAHHCPAIGGRQGCVRCR